MPPSSCRYVVRSSLPRGPAMARQDRFPGLFRARDVQRLSLWWAKRLPENLDSWSARSAVRSPIRWWRTDLPALPRKARESFQYGIFDSIHRSAPELLCTNDRRLLHLCGSRNGQAHMQHMSRLGTRRICNLALASGRRQFLRNREIQGFSESEETF